MSEKFYADASSPYILTEMPLIEDDIEKLNTLLSNSYKMNILLLPLLVIILFWGLLYFSAFAAFVLICNIFFTKAYFSTKRELLNSKIVITGIVSSIYKNEETIINFGSERFDITYANVKFPIRVNDSISIHYAMTEKGTRGHLLKIEVLT